MKASRRGFTLMEIAIVLGVMGAITAAIFTAASLAQARVQLNAGIDELNLIAGNMKSLYAGRNTSFAALAPPATPNFTTYNATFVQEGVFPIQMLSARPVPGQAIVSGTTASHVWDQTQSGGSAQVSLTGSSGLPVQFVVRFYNVPAAACAGLVTQTSQPGVDTGLTQVNVNNTIIGQVSQTTYQVTNSARMMPIPAINASTGCAGSGPFTVDWYYNLAGS